MIARVPVTLLTGFLGSGKTTMFARLLRNPGVGRIAAIVNEFGDTDLDHDLLEASSEDVVTLGNGCLCCAMRGNLAGTLRDLVGRRERDPRVGFDRVVIETSGLADPVPVLRLLIGDPWIAERFDVAGVVTTVDAVNGERTLLAHPEAQSQVAVADLLAITKTDLASSAAVERLERELAERNPTAPRIRVRHGDADPRWLLDPGALATAPARPLRPARAGPAGYRRADDRPVHADTGIRSIACSRERPLSPDRFDRVLALLGRLSGPDLLRAKGILCVEGRPLPLAVHAAQDLVHPPAPVATPTSPARSRLVVIGRRLDAGALAELAAEFDPPAAH